MTHYLFYRFHIDCRCSRFRIGRYELSLHRFEYVCVYVYIYTVYMNPHVRMLFCRLSVQGLTIWLGRGFPSPNMYLC